MAFIERKADLATIEEISVRVDHDGKYEVQIGVDKRAGTEWPVYLKLVAFADGTYGIETFFFGSHTAEEGEEYATFEEALDCFFEYYNDVAEDI